MRKKFNIFLTVFGWIVSPPLMAIIYFLSLKKNKNLVYIPPNTILFIWTMIWYLGCMLLYYFGI